MFWVFFLAVVFLIAALLVYAKVKAQGINAETLPYVRNAVLFSPAERSFLGVLEQAVGDTYSIFGKVRVADVASVRQMKNRSAWQRAFNRISAKHFDFLLCTKTDLAIVCAIELDDVSHAGRKRKARDAFLADLCAAAGLPLVQVPAKRGYASIELRTQIFQKLGLIPGWQGGGGSGRQDDAYCASTVDQTSATVPTTREAMGVTLSDSTDNPTCPKCSASMLQRFIKTGSKAGETFWSCSKFPKCSGVRVAAK